MRRVTYIFLFGFAASGVCWLPMQMQPSYGWPFWAPACSVFITSVACASLLGRAWCLAVLSVACGVLAASLLGFEFWWPDDPIAVPWVPIAVTVASVGAVFIGLLGGALGYGIQHGHARVPRWQAYTTTAAVTVLGSAAIAGNGLLVTHKIRTDRMVAEKRVRSLYDAAVCAVGEHGDLSSAQDGIKVERCYHGPAFNSSEWQGMTRNFMRRNGYVYQIHLALPPAQGVLVYALPIEYRDRVKVGLCLDSSGRTRCPLNVSRGQACIPCEGKKE